MDIESMVPPPVAAERRRRCAALRSAGAGKRAVCIDAAAVFAAAGD
jgi:hypothetical protein